MKQTGEEMTLGGYVLRMRRSFVIMRDGGAVGGQLAGKLVPAPYFIRVTVTPGPTQPQ